MWSKKDYALACTEMKMAAIEASMIQELSVYTQKPIQLSTLRSATYMG